MKKTTSRILLSALTVLALLSLSGCAQEKEENTKQSDPQAREAILQCCETIFGSTEETGAYHIRVTDERDGAWMNTTAHAVQTSRAMAIRLYMR